MKRAVLSLLLLCLPAAFAAAGEGATPRWSLEIKGGRLQSAMEEWADYYGDDSLPLFGVGVGYKVWRPLEVGLELGYARDRGQGFAPIHGVTAGTVRYELLPVHLSATLRGVFREDQWLVPYAGAAAGRYGYRISVSGQDRISGSTGGSQYRAGLQFLLDRLDPRSAYELHRHGGINNTYLFVEYQKTRARLQGSDLGGEAWLGGLLFEF